MTIWIKKYKYRLILSSVIIVPVVLGYCLSGEGGILADASDKVSYYGFSLTILAITVAIIQAARTMDWNRRITAMNHLSDIRVKIRTHTALINKHFDYIERGENDMITVDQIHDAICLKENGKFIQHPTTKKLQVSQDPEAKATRTAISELLNAYEGISAGVYQGIYDRELIAELMASNIIKAANTFERYIDHYNNEMYRERNGRVWINLKTFGAELKEEFRQKTIANKRPKA